MLKAWMRVLTIKLTSKKFNKQLIFGENWKNGGIDLNISVSGTKFLSPMEDECVVKITNLTYKEIVTIINGEFYDIEIIAGYRNANVFTIFKGGVLYVSNELGDRKSNDVILICTNNLVAKFGQSKLNISLNSGINMYGAIKFITERAGIKNTYIDEKFKNMVLRESEAQTESITSWLDILCDTHGLVVNGDSSEGNDLSIWNPSISNSRVINLKNDNVILTGGYPTLDSNGLKIAIMPTINLCPGDTIVLDNSIIDIGTSSRDEAVKNVGQFLDRDGKYVIMEIDFDLENRNSNFSYKIKARAKSLWNRLGELYG